MKWNTKETLFVEYANILKLIIDIFCGFGWLIDWEYKDVILTGKGSQKYYESNLKSNIILLWKYTINLNREIFKNLMTIYIRKEWHGLCFWHNNSFFKKAEPIFFASWHFGEDKYLWSQDRGLSDLFVWGFSSHSKIFHSFGDVTITSGGLQILTYARHSWPLSSDGSLANHTYCDTGHPFIMVISEDPWHSHLMPSVCSEAVTKWLNDFGLSLLGF